MNTALLLIGSIVYFLLAYVVYGRFLGKIFGIDPSVPCPSHTMQDGVDYVPAHPSVLFGHHFASIAGAGPIVGPILAAKYGWLPACLWILLGCVFIGAMHDFSALFLSVRNRGRSIAYVIEKEIGYVGRQLFVGFCLVALILVVTVFANQVADTFIKNPGVATASIAFILMAPFFGILVNQKMLSTIECTLIFVPIMFLLVWIGTLIPCDLIKLIGVTAAQARVIWMLFLLYYAFIASTIPVWFLLQPRDYLNSFLLYAMMIIGVGGIIAARAPIQLPSVMLPQGHSAIPDILPLLFVTIACGACSGFHALVASGTSSKQIDNEKDIVRIGYGGMLLEGVLAIISVCAVGYLSNTDFAELCKSCNNAAPVMFANGVGHFAEALGIPYQLGSTFIALAISAFIMTSLDTATRLARFLLQEIAMPRLSDSADGEEAAAMPQACGFHRLIANRWFSTLCIVVLAGILSFSGSGTMIWPVFGSANQMLAALTLLGLTLYLLRNKRPWLFAFFPLLFMAVISVWALFNLIRANFGHNNVLAWVGCLLMVMALWVIVIGGRKLLSYK